MGIFDLFSKRQKRLRGEVPDVYKYDEIPNHLRVQIVHIIRDCFGRDIYGSADHARNAYEFVHNVLCREYGLFQLKEHADSHAMAISHYFLNCQDYERVLDIIELSFKVIDHTVREYRYQDITTTKISPDDAIDELNGRFKEHGIGYQFEAGELIRVDSKFLHSEVVKPVLEVLSAKMYKGANEEFLKAHEHYRHGRNKECLNECLKAFESVMKAICDKHKWPYNKNDTSKKLISICLSNNLIPSYMQTQFSSLASLLESGVPTIRNKLGGHGQGSSTIQVSNTITSYALHLAATNILFLTESEKELI